MYCKPELLKLAFAKGYTRCSCSNGGYPDCICDMVPYGNVRLDDVQRWLRNTHTIDISIWIRFDDTYGAVIHQQRERPKGFEELITKVTYENHRCLYETTLESAINYSLRLI